MDAKRHSSISNTLLSRRSTVLATVGLILIASLAVFLTHWSFSNSEKQVVNHQMRVYQDELQQIEQSLRGRFEWRMALIQDHNDQILEIPDLGSWSERLQRLSKMVEESRARRLAYLDDDYRLLAEIRKNPDLPSAEKLENLPDGKNLPSLLRRATLTRQYQVSGLVREEGEPTQFNVVIPLKRPTVPLLRPDEETEEPDASETVDEEENVPPTAAFLLIVFDVRWLNDWFQKWKVSENTLLWVMKDSGKVLYHPNPSFSDINLLADKTVAPSIRKFARDIMAVEYFSQTRKIPLHGSAASEEWLSVTRRVRFNDTDLFVILSSRTAPLMSPLSMAMRGVFIMFSIFLVAVLVLAHLWQQSKRTEIETYLRNRLSADLEKMVEARTVELNFVTRTIKDLIDSIPSALVVLNRQLEILLVNLSFYSIFSSRLINLTGRHISEVYSDELVQRLHKILRTKEPIIDLEMRKYIEGQGEKVLMINVLHLLGKRDRLLLVIDDISERKVLERQLIQAEKMAGLGTLMSGVAHEINNPLNAIAGMAQIITARSKDEEIKDDAKQIMQYVNRVAEIVKELSRYSRSTKVTDAVTSDIHNVIEGALGMVSHSRKMKTIEVEKQFTHGLPGIKINVVEMEQVFINLITNAIDALDDAEKVKEDGYRPKVRIATSLHGGEFVQIVVEDNGTGIAPENLKSVFDPFFSTKEQGKGTGLGLSICYKIFQRYGGIILVDSQLQIGTKFTLRLPINF